MVKSIDRAAYIDPIIKRRARSRLDRPFVILMEYVPGVLLIGMGSFRARAALDPNFPESRDRLIRTGILIATDCFLNNSDRMPLIWHNDGNSENIIVKMDTGWLTTTEELKNPENLNLKMLDIYAIDTRPYLYNKDNNISSANYDKYMETFEKMLSTLFEVLAQVKDGKINPYEMDAKRFEYASLVSTFIYNYTEFDIKPLGELQLLLGMTVGFANILSFGYERIVEIYKKIALTPKSDWLDVWKDNAKGMKIEMLADLLSLIKKYMRKNEELMGWVNMITLNNYLIKFDELIVKKDNGEIEDPSANDEDTGDSALDKKVKDYFGLSMEDMKKDIEFEQEQEKIKQEEEEEERRIAEEEQQMQQQRQLAIQKKRKKKLENKRQGNWK